MNENINSSILSERKLSSNKKKSLDDLSMEDLSRSSTRYTKSSSKLSSMFDDTNSDHSDEEEANFELKNNYMNDLAQMVGSGSFLGAAVLIERGHFDPITFVLDKNCGTLVGHYAAHYGHIKFLRWMVTHIGANQYYQYDQMVDNYGCNMAHYSVRQGHLHILIWLASDLGINLKSRDVYGYSPLDYSIIYTKFHCFLFIIYKYGFKDINE
jgi:hypothetical protein